MIDLIIEHGTVFTMNPRHEIIEDGAIAVDRGNIVEVGTSEEISSTYNVREKIDASRKAILPGFVDIHGHAGEGLIKTVAEHTHLKWLPIADHIFLRSTNEDAWYADGLLNSIERIKFGVTCGIAMLGGNSPRVDDPIFARRHAQAVEQTGVKEFLCVGPPPFVDPVLFSRWDGNRRTDREVSFDESLAVSEKIIQEWNGGAEGRIKVWLSPINTYRVSEQLADDYGYGAYGVVGEEEIAVMVRQAQAIRQLADEYHVGIHSHAITGEVEFAHKRLHILGPDVILAHCNGLTQEEIRIFNTTGARVAHCPNGRRIIADRCPVPELISAGVTVGIASDAASPDRTFDLFENMRLAMKYQRMYFKSAAVMPPGKLLEMVTIEPAKALGMEKSIGSLEKNKRADIILVDLFKPHLVPYFMIPQRLVYEASGHDVDTVIIDGKVVMKNRIVQTVDERKSLELAQVEAENVVELSGVKPLMEMPAGFWGLQY